MQPNKDIASARKTGLGLTLREMTWVGKVFYKSGVFTDTRDEAVAIVKIMAGQEIGLPPFEAMTGINLIEGRPSLAATTIAAKIKGNRKYDYRVKIATELKSQIDFFEIEPGGKRTSIGSSTFTIEQAKAAKLFDPECMPGKHVVKQVTRYKKGGGSYTFEGCLCKDNWKAYPEDMLFARNISRGARRFTPDIFGAPVYTADELEEDAPGGLTFIPPDGGHKALSDGKPEQPPVDDPPENDSDDLDDSVAETPAEEPKEELPAPEPTRYFDQDFMNDVVADIERLQLDDIELKRFIRNATGKITTKNLTEHQWRSLKDAVDLALVERQEQQSLDDIDQDGE
jgi:hypothetical protein